MFYVEITLIFLSFFLCVIDRQIPGQNSLIMAVFFHMMHMVSGLVTSLLSNLV